MSLRPLPSGTTHILSPDGMQFLPVFVQARLDYLASCLEWFPSEDEIADGVETVFAYHEVRGALSDGHYSVNVTAEHRSPIHLWIAGDDNCCRSLYIGGICWICPDNETLYFDAIDPTLLPETPDSNIWWCINYEEGIKVIKIAVCPLETISEEFPDEL